MRNRRNVLLLAATVVLLLSLLVTVPARAHGGAGDARPDPAGPWMVGLIYVQLIMVPIVGFWLAGQALAAWRPMAGGRPSEGD